MENPIGFPHLEDGTPVPLLTHQDVHDRGLGQVKKASSTRRDGLPPLPDVKEFISLEGQPGVEVSPLY